MKIKDVSPKKTYRIVVTDQDPYNGYVRFGPHSWYCYMGESLEPVYLDEELEEAFRAIIQEEA